MLMVTPTMCSYTTACHCYIGSVPDPDFNTTLNKNDHCKMLAGQTKSFIADNLYRIMSTDFYL